jgi:hypothetical protein
VSRPTGDAREVRGDFDARFGAEEPDVDWKPISMKEILTGIEWHGLSATNPKTAAVIV